MTGNSPSEQQCKWCGGQQHAPGDDCPALDHTRIRETVIRAAMHDPSDAADIAQHLLKKTTPKYGKELLAGVARQRARGK